METIKFLTPEGLKSGSHTVLYTYTVYCMPISIQLICVTYNDTSNYENLFSVSLEIPDLATLKSECLAVATKLLEPPNE